MARVCTVCTHEKRAIIDRIIAQGSLSNRAVASQFGLNRGAIDRHSDHLKDSVVKAAQVKARKQTEAVQGDWNTRLESLHAAACRGIERAEADPDKWTHAAGFIATGIKACDVGMRASGEIAGGTTINVGHMLVMPQPGVTGPAPGIATPARRELAAGPVLDAEIVDE